jgi:hypothetical protein
VSLQRILLRVSMTSLNELIEKINTKAVYLQELLLSQIIAFILVCSRLKYNILLLWPSTQLTAPGWNHNVSWTVLQYDPEFFEACWSALSSLIWHSDNMLHGVLDDRLALQETCKAHGGPLYREYNLCLTNKDEPPPKNKLEAFWAWLVSQIAPLFKLYMTDHGLVCRCKKVYKYIYLPMWSLCYQYGFDMHESTFDQRGRR